MTTTYVLTGLTSSPCLGATASGQATVTVTTAPTAAFSAAAFSSCGPGQNVNLPITITGGSSPWNLIYSINGVAQPPVAVLSNFYNLVVSPSLSTTYAIVSISSGACTGPSSSTATVTVGTPPQASITGSDQICTGETSQIEVAFLNGSSPWTFVYAQNGVAQASVAAATNPYILTVAPSQNTSYSLVSVASNGCTGTVSGSGQVNVTALPTATLNATSANALCGAGSAQLTVGFGGTNPGPWTVFYTANGVAQPPAVLNSNPGTINVTVSQSTTYALTSVSANGCSGTASGSVSIAVETVSAALSPATATVCEVGQTANLTVTFSGNAPAPFTFGYSINGAAQAPITTSSNPYILSIPVSAAATVVLTSVQSTPNLCSGTASGSTTLSVNGPTASFASSTTSFCGAGNPANLTVNFTGQAPWTFSFSENGTPQPPVTTSANPFTLVVTPSVSSTYTLTAVSAAGCTGSATGSATVNITTPPTAVLAGSATVCSGSTVPLSVNFSNGAAPWTFSYTENGVQKGPITTSDDPFVLTVSPTVTTNFVLTAVASGTCAGTATGTANVTVFPALTAQILGGGTVAPGQSTNLTLSLPGAPTGVSITYVLSANGVNLPPITTTQNPHLFSVTPSLSTTYAIVSCSVGPCQMGQTGTATVTVLSAFSATILGVDTLCKNEMATIEVDFDGAAAPFSFVYSINGVAQPAVSTSNDPHFFNVSPMVTSVYELVSATAGAQSGTVSGTAKIVVNAPFLTITGGVQAICNGDQATVNVSLQNGTGTPPFTFQLTENGSATAPIVSTGATYGFTVSPTVTTTYQLFSGTADGCAAGLSTAIFEVEVQGPPTANNVSIACNLAAMTYTVSFDLSNATAGLATVNGTPAPNGPFTSGPIPMSQNYAFLLENACGTSNLMGQNTCSCATDAGTMTSLDTVKACIGPITVAHNGDQMTEPGDLFRFMLHTQPSNPYGDVILIKDTPTFTFDAATMLPNTVYWISAVAGNNDGGFIDYNDPCLSIAVGTPVMWLAPPEAFLTAADTAICAGTVAQLNIAFSSVSQPPFTFTYTRNGVPAPQVTTNQMNYSIGAFLNQTTTFQVISLSAGGCPAATLPPPVTIHIIPTPEFDGLPTVDCDLTTGTYVVSSLLTGGNGQYLFSGGGGSIIGQALVSQPIPIGTPYQYFLYDTEQCGSDTIAGIGNCTCATDAGDFLSLGPIEFCSGEADTLDATLGQFLEPDDTLIYVLHTSTGPNPQLWTILATNTVPYFTFNAGLIEPDSIYFVSAVAGNLTPAGLDLGDPCLSISQGMEIKWRKPVSGFLSENVEICQGDSVELVFAFSGDDAPYTFDFLENGLLQPPLVSNSDTFRLWVSPTLSANYSLNSVNGANCAGSINGGGGAAVSVRLPAFPVDLNVKCDFSSQTYTVEFKISNGADTAKTYSVSGTAGVLTKDTVFNSLPIPFGQPYSVNILNPIGCEVVVAGIGQCVCSTNAGTMTAGQDLHGCIGAGPVAVLHNGDEQLDPDDTTLKFILFSDENDPTGSILARSGFPAAFDFDDQKMTAGQKYFVAAVAGNPDGSGSVDLDDLCLSVSPPVAITFHEPPTAVISGMATVCPGDPASVQIDFVGTAPFEFRYSINSAAGPSIATSQNPFEIMASAPLVDLNFSMVSVSDAFCNGVVSGLGLIDVLPTPTGQVFGTAQICPGFSTSITVILAGAPAFNVTMSDGQVFSNVTQSFNFPVMPGQTTNYSITNLEAIGTPCPPKILGTAATVTVAGLGLDLTEKVFSNGFNVSCNGASDGSMTVVATGGQAPYSYQWSNQQGTGPTVSSLPAGWFQVTVFDALGCRDSIWEVIHQPPPMTLDWRADSPACFGFSDGALSIENLVGAAPPFSISIDGKFSATTDTLPLVFQGLEAGAYQILVEDKNGCEAEFSATVDAKGEILVDLGPDITVSLGDSVLLKGQISAPVDSFVWSPVKYLSDPTSLQTWVKPLATQLFELRVFDENGCSGKDAIFVLVDPSLEIYAPTVFAPESDANNLFTIYAGPQVAEITDFRIFDRWGDLVFKNENFQPGDPQKGWDGTYGGSKKGAVAVYVWWAKIALVDGTSVVLKGDVTLVR